MFFKKVRLIEGLREVDAVQLWEVRWTSRHGSYFGDTRPEVEVFDTEVGAQEFADTLEKCFKLLKSSGNETRVSVSKAK